LENYEMEVSQVFCTMHLNYLPSTGGEEVHVAKRDVYSRNSEPHAFQSK